MNRSDKRWIALFLILGGIGLATFNLLAYLVFLWFGVLLDSGWSLVQTDSLYFQVNGAVLLILGVLPLGLPFWTRLAGSRSSVSG